MRGATVGVFTVLFASREALELYLTSETGSRIGSIQSWQSQTKMGYK